MQLLILKRIEAQKKTYVHKLQETEEDWVKAEFLKKMPEQTSVLKAGHNDFPNYAGTGKMVRSKIDGERHWDKKDEYENELEKVALRDMKMFPTTKHLDM